MTAHSNTRGLSKSQCINHDSNRAPGDNKAALRGASLAFGAPHVKAESVANNYAEPFGALAAAKKADTGNQWHTPSSSSADLTVSNHTCSKESTGSASLGDAPLSAAVQSVLRERLRELSVSRKQESSLELPHSRRSSVAPSNIAAALAAYRSTSQTPHTQAPNRPRPPTMSDGDHKDVLPPAGTVKHTTRLFAQSNGNQLDGAVNISTNQLRASRFQSRSSIGPAQSLIGIYERKTPTSTERGRETPILSPRNEGPAIQSPKSFRPPSISKPPPAAILTPARTSSVAQEAVEFDTLKTQKNRQSNGLGPPPVSVRYINKDRNDSHAEVQNTPCKSYNAQSTTIRERLPKAITPPKPPPPRKTQVPTLPTATVQSARNQSDDSSTASRVSELTITSKPAVPPPRKDRGTPKERAPRSAKIILEHVATDTATNTPQIGVQQPKPINIPQQRLEIPSRPLHPSRPRSWVDDPSSSGDSSKRRSMRGQQAFPYMTEDSLANAIVASSLASSRASSPAVSPQPPMPGRHSKPHHYFRHESHTPSPPKTGMRHTMRGPPRSDDEDEPNHKRGRKNLIKKHPHKHHEADRKRWRDQLTERERKRYEGVWAANKGLHIHFSPAQLHQTTSRQLQSVGREAGKDLVASPVVRDIWSRSRLPPETLQEIWALVDRNGVRKLDREEFVVGMWLIDQSLKGRKLPIKVSESVWGSVRRLGGIKAPKRRK